MKLTKEQAIIISGFTMVLCCDFSDLHKAIEKKLGRPVFTHELADKSIVEKIKESFRKDFESIIPITPKPNQQNGDEK